MSTIWRAVMGSSAVLRSSAVRRGPLIWKAGTPPAALPAGFGELFEDEIPAGVPVDDLDVCQRRAAFAEQSLGFQGQALEFLRVRG